VDVWSSYSRFNTDYIYMSGTSMASPHSAGAVALLWSCNPSLVGQIDTTFQLLQSSARDSRLSVCGGPPDGEGNYSFGYGYLDVLEAGFYTCGGVPSGILQGHVYNAVGNPLVQATVTISSGSENSFQTITDQYGAYTIRVPIGSYSVTAFLNGYLANTISDTAVLVSETTTLDFHLTYLGLWTEQLWSPCTNLTRFDAEFFPATGLVYILGGRYVYLNAEMQTVDTTVGNVFSFDPATGVCSPVPDGVMPFPVSNYTISLINFNGADVLCTFGGRTATGAQTLAVQCYDPLTNIAAQITNLPADPYTNATPGAQVVYDNQVYLFGGIDVNASTTETNLAHTFRYDPLTNKFARLDDLTIARGYLMAAVVDGQIYAFGGDEYDGDTLIPQTITEVMVDPAGAGVWDDTAVADLPASAGGGRAIGFDRDSGYQLAGKVAIIALAQYPGASYEVITYDVLSDTYDLNYPNLNVPRRNHAAVFVPVNTPTPGDGLPGMWVMGGFCTGGTCGGDHQPYGPPEFFPVYLVKHFYVPFIFR
jgi:hypothetical protein